MQNRRKANRRYLLYFARVDDAATRQQISNNIKYFHTRLDSNGKTNPQELERISKERVLNNLQAA